MGIFEEKPLRKLLSERKTLILDEPLVKKFGLYPSLSSEFVEVLGVDSEIRAMEEDLRRTLEAEGHPPGRTRMALELAADWTMKMAQAFVPPEMLEDPEVKKRIIKHLYPKAKEVALRWARAMAV